MENLKLRLFPLKFSSREWEKAFIKVHRAPKDVRLAISLAIPFYILYIPLDHYLFPEHFGQFLFIRLGCVLAITAVLFLLTFSKIYEKISGIIIIIIALAASGGILAMECIARGSDNTRLYFFGIAQVLMYFYGIGKVSLVPSIITGALITTTALLFDIFLLESSTGIILTKAFFLLTIMGLGIIISTIIQFQARNNFINRIRIEKLSVTDTLTGLKNRHFYENLLEEELLAYVNRPDKAQPAQLSRAEDFPGDRFYGLVLMDLDHFKKVNDTYGHPAGDEILKEFGKRITGLIRLTDVLIRWGGEEFLLVLKNTSKEFMEQLTAEIQRVISDTPFDTGRRDKITVTVSGGMMLVPPRSENNLDSTGSFIRLIDEALYRSKNAGRNCFTWA